MIESPDSILNPTIFIGSLELREPVTSITDLLIAITCGIAFWILTNNKSERTASFEYYRGFFLMYAFGMTSAAFIGHGLQAYFGPEWKMLGWFFSMTGQALLILGSLTEVKQHLKPRYFNTIIFALASQFIIFSILLLNPSTRSFEIAQMSSVIALVGFVIPLQLFGYLRNNNIGSMLVISAIVYGLAPGYVFNNQISLNRWFNYHDISHVLVVVYMIIMTFALRKLALKSSLLAD